MEIQRQNGTLNISGVRELSAANARLFRNEVCARLAPELHHIDIDLSQTSLVDSCGLGALMSLYKAANDQSNNGGVAVRLVNPQPPVQQVFELTRMHLLFEIVLSDAQAANGLPAG
jgi:anti-sigma B factor antagonist